MVKRFTDTEKFNDTWYRKLSPLHKVIWEYLLAECNHAGILEKLDLELMSFKIGTNVSVDDLKFFEDRIVFLNDNTLFIPKFIKFQYNNLTPKNKMYKPVLKELEKWGINPPSIPHLSPIDGVKDMVKVKDKDIVSSNKGIEEKEKNKKEKEEILTTISRVKSTQNPDLMFDSQINKIFEIYKIKCENLIPVLFEDRDLSFRQDILEFLTLTRGDFAYFEELCKKANELKFIVNKKIDIKALINNHTRIYSGFYKDTGQVECKQNVKAFFEEKI